MKEPDWLRTLSEQILGFSRSVIIMISIINIIYILESIPMEPSSSYVYVLQVTNEQWDMMEAMIRKSSKSQKSKL